VWGSKRKREGSGRTQKEKAFVFSVRGEEGMEAGGKENNTA